MGWLYSPTVCFPLSAALNDISVLPHWNSSSADRFPFSQQPGAEDEG